MHSIKKIIPPDPLYDHIGVEFPERSWQLVASDNFLKGDVDRPDFGQHVLLGMAEDSLLSQALNETDSAQIEAFIRRYYVSLNGIDRLSLEQLETLQKTITQSILYQTSHERARYYLTQLIYTEIDESEFPDRSVLFFAGFLDRFVLDPTASRLTEIVSEKLSTDDYAYRA